MFKWSPAFAAEPAASQKASTSATSSPWSENQLATALGRLAAPSDGLITKELVERELNTELHLVDPHRLAVQQTDIPVYGTTAFVDGNFDLSFSQTKNKTAFTFGWGSHPGTSVLPLSHPRAQPCVDEKKLSTAFRSTGWKVTSRSVNDSFTAVVYQKGRGEILHSFGTRSSCLLSLLFISAASQ